MLLNARQIQRGSGKERIILLAIEDITERKEIEAGLEKTRKELEVIKRSADEALEYSESLVNTVREPLISLNQDLRVVTASRSFYEVFKVNHEETVGQLIYDLGNKQWDIPKLRELLEDILPQKAAFDNYEVEHDFSTIGRRIMLLNARQIQRGSGKERIILLAIEDITERKQVENAMHAAKQAVEAASRAKSEFLANMSHELRTPLNSIIGFSEVLHDQAFGPLNPKQTKYVDNVLTSGQHLLSLINDILDLSKVEAGKMTVEARSFVVRPMLENALILVKERAMKRGLMLSLEAPDDLTVSADERMLKQILFNLLSNAVKFTEPGGRIAVTAERAGDDLRVSVADTGIGIKPEDQARLFTEFEQLDSGYDRMHQGTGLGLAITRKFVELHGGRIWAESEGEGKGSTFRFTLPLIREDRKAPKVLAGAEVKA
jgi:two-component system CheB/CheR fusion protein